MKVKFIVRCLRRISGIFDSFFFSLECGVREIKEILAEFGKFERKVPLPRPKGRWKCNIRSVLKTQMVGIDLVQLIQDSGK